MQRYCKLIFGTLGMPSHTHHKQEYHLVGNSDVYPETKTQLDPSLFYRDITLYRILQSDWSGTFWLITPDQEFCQAWELRWKVKNYKKFLFALFSGKSNDNIFKKCKIPYFWVLFAQISNQLTQVKLWELSSETRRSKKLSLNLLSLKYIHQGILTWEMYI